MKKFIFCITLFIFLILSSCSYTMREPKPEDTNLEFWITEDVTNFDFSSYQPKYGLFGGRMYYGTGYMPTYDDENNQIDPDRYVIYTVTNYPDYSSKSQAITEIKISDPDIHFYGLSSSSTDEEIANTLSMYGYKKDENELTFTKGKIKICFYNNTITLSVEVTNKEGIIF